MVMLKFLFLLFVSAVFADRATYYNYQVHRLVPENQEQLEALKDMEDDSNGVRIRCLEFCIVMVYQESSGSKRFQKSYISVVTRTFCIFTELVLN